MAKDFRVTLFFGQANIGFSESYYVSGNTHNEVAVKAATMLDFRNTMMTENIKCLGIRASIEGERRNSMLYSPGLNYLPGLNTPINFPADGDFPGGVAENSPDQARACLHVGWLSGGRRVAIRYFAGIPDNVTRYEPNSAMPQGNPLWYSHFLNFAIHLKQNGWSVKTKQGDAVNPRRPVIRWLLRTAAPSVLGAQMAVANSINPPVGSKVTVNGTRMSYDGLRSPNGQWYVDAVETSDDNALRTVWLRNATNFDPDTIRVLGTIRGLAYEFLTPDALQIIRAGVHKRGKPFGAPVGRARVKRYSN